MRSYHHFADVAAITAALAAHLNPGGNLMVIDFNRANGVVAKCMASRHHGHGAHKHAVPHVGGFTSDELSGLLAGVSLLADARIETAFAMSLSELRDNGGGQSWSWLVTDEAREAEAAGLRVETLLASATRAA